MGMDARGRALGLIAVGDPGPTIIRVAGGFPEAFR